jgi:hypothetical protein
MEPVLDSLARGGGSFVCAECGHELGPETGDYRSSALHFDDPITAGEPPELFAVVDDEYILRHYCCPGCGALFEVEMLPLGAPPRESVRLSGTGSS